MEPSKTEKQKTAKAGASVGTWPKRWKEISHEVRRLQMRIAKAVKESRWGKVKVLQYLLTRSPYRQTLGGKASDLEQRKKDPGH